MRSCTYTRDQDDHCVQVLFATAVRQWLRAPAATVVLDGRTWLARTGRGDRAADGLGACRDGRPVRVTGPARLAEAIIAIGDYGTEPDVAPRNA